MHFCLCGEGSTSPTLSDTSTFPLFSRTVATDSEAANAVAEAVLEGFGWKRFGMLFIGEAFFFALPSPGICLFGILIASSMAVIRDRALAEDRHRRRTHVLISALRPFFPPPHTLPAPIHATADDAYGSGYNNALRAALQRVAPRLGMTIADYEVSPRRGYEPCSSVGNSGTALQLPTLRAVSRPLSNPRGVPCMSHPRRAGIREFQGVETGMWPGRQCSLFPGRMSQDWPLTGYCSVSINSTSVCQ